MLFKRSLPSAVEQRQHQRERKVLGKSKHARSEYFRCRKGNVVVGCCLTLVCFTNYYWLLRYAGTGTSEDSEWKRYAALEEKKFLASGPIGPPPKVSLEPLTRPIDLEHYTIRMNTFQRPQQLRLSLSHYLSCEGVQQIHVIWCLAQGNPPKWLLSLDKQNRIVIEPHSINSLNERFHMLVEPPTLGILSIDDDVLRPCIALDHAFTIWTQAPDKMVGFDPRAIVDEQDGSWRYTLTGETLKKNGYGLVLTKSAFLHRDYLKGYMSPDMTAFRDLVDSAMNCEDIAMSLYVSAVNGGTAPLVVDFWAQERSLVALGSESKISGTRKTHLRQRSWCLDVFGRKLGLKAGGYKNQKLFHSGKKEFFGVVRDPLPQSLVSKRGEETNKVIERWKSLPGKQFEVGLQDLVQHMASKPFEQNLIVMKDNKFLDLPENHHNAPTTAKNATHITTS